MPKRILAAMIGVLAVLAGLVASSSAIDVSKDFRYPAVNLCASVVGETIACAMAVTGFGIGIRFLCFAWTGRDDRSLIWMKPILTSIGLFFPGFVFSLPLALVCGSRDIALEISIGIGLASSVVCAVWWIRQRTTFL